MKHLFIVNPAAGKGLGIDKLIRKINTASHVFQVESEIHITTGIGDAENFVRAYCSEKDSGERVRVYACGGDGTLNEVVNGIYGFELAEAACIPTGSGNDFVRNFDGGDPLDIEAQINGTQQPVDLLKYTELRERDPKTRYCINMFNIGFDSDIAFRVAELKKIPLITGPMAYLVGTFSSLAKKKSINLKAIFDDGKVHDGPVLQIDIGNGCYYGGGIKAVPGASMKDGLLDVSIVEDVSILRFLRLFPKYKKGTHLSVKRIEEIVTYTQCRSLIIEPDTEKMRICTDGEISAAGPLRIEVVPSAILFSVPAKE